MYAYALQALIHGLNRHYYSLLINYRKNELEERMLLNLSKKGWAAGVHPVLLVLDYHFRLHVPRRQVKASTSRSYKARKA